MKELLYLKDTQLKQLIEGLFTSYRESYADVNKVMSKYSIGVAHLKVLHLLSMYKGITISQLLKKLKITKQSLNRVLKDLIKMETIFFDKNQDDTRVKHVFLNEMLPITRQLQDIAKNKSSKFKICSAKRLKCN